MKRIWDQEFARRVDILSSTLDHIEPEQLMQSAGQALFEEILRLRQGRKVLIVCGWGNNGGDALVAAKLLHEHKISVEVLYLEHETQSDGFRREFLKYKKLNPNALSAFKTGSIERFKNLPLVIVDGIYGIGFRLPENNPLIVQCIKEINAIPKKFVLAVDIPSGTIADQVGAARTDQICVKSDVCVSFGGMKAVNVFSPARDLCGQVICRDIGFGSNALQEAKNEIPSKAVYICEFDFRDDPWEEKLSPSAHKFDRGHVLVIGGSEGKTGAPILSGLAALRAGAGWASVAIPPTLLRREKDIPLELTFEDFFDGKHIDAECLSVFLKDRNVRSVVIGPGTMDSCLDTESFEVLTAFAAQGHFVIVDAGATRGFLDFLEDKDPLAASRFILTPHPGEWRQLGGDLLQDFFSLGDLESCAQKIRKIGVNLCYKGATPIIFSSDVPAVFTGNDNSLAKAGTGDIVSGLSGACSLISDSPVDILGRAFSLMQRSVERLIKERNRHSLLPSDLLSEINKN